MNHLTNTESGSTGEQSVIGKLMRFGIKISKPFWNDDEVDFEIKYGRGDNSINIPVQVKTVQFNKKNDKIFIQGLKKKYVERNELLCLAVYNPQFDWFWFVSGNREITKIYESQKNWNKKHKYYKDLKNDNDLRIGVPKDGISLLADYKIELNDKVKLTESIKKIASRKKVNIIPDEKNELIDINGKIRLEINLVEKKNIKSKPTEFNIEGSISNIITVAHEIFQEFLEENQIEKDFSLLFRELFINSVAHRSYEDNNPNKIFLSKNRIVISNPGGLVKELTIDHILDKSIIATRNPKLSYDLVKVGLMESFGAGIYRAEKIVLTLSDWDTKFYINNNEFIAEITKNNVA